MLWLWHRLAATAPIQPLAWRSSTCCGCGPKKKERKKRNSFYVGPSLRLEKGEHAVVRRNCKRRKDSEGDQETEKLGCADKMCR